MIAGDSGGDPNAIASGTNSGSVVLVPDGLKKKKRKPIKTFKEFKNSNIVERWNPFSDLDNYKMSKFFLGTGKSVEVVTLFSKMTQRYKAGKWEFKKMPLEVLADITKIKVKLLIHDLELAGFSDKQINIGKGSVKFN
jgi:hypothetical protein